MLGYLINKIDKSSGQFLNGNLNCMFAGITLSECTYPAQLKFTKNGGDQKTKVKNELAIHAVPFDHSL
jgi:hypothetical protein